MVHSALKQAVEECIWKAISHLTAAFIRFHSCFWQKNTSQYPLLENPKDRFCRTTQRWPEARSRFSRVFSFTALLYSFPSFCLLFPNPQHPSGWLHEHNLLKCGKKLDVFIRGFFFFLDTFQWDHARGRMRASRLESAQATSLIISIRAYSSSLALHMEVPFHLLKA